MIPDAAVEGARLSLFYSGVRNFGAREVRAALEAAAPHLLAGAWEDGEAAGQDNAAAYQTGNQVTHNPYRTAK